MANWIIKFARRQTTTLVKTSIVTTALAAALLAAPAMVEPAQADDGLLVYKDQAKVYRISRAAGTIIIGNPDLLAATVQDLQTIVLTGKAYGTTNMIVLDDAGEPILDEMVIVSQNENSLVRVYAGSDVSTLSCSAGACQPAKVDEQ
jgi:Flp pilus assembly secretin CpaC